MKLSKDAATIRKELFAHIESVQDDYVNKGWLPSRMNLNNGIIRGLLEIFIWGIFQLYSFLDHIMQQAVPNKATGEWLDIHAEGVDLIRKKATKAYGNITFIRRIGTDSNIKIPAGKIVRTPADGEGKHYRYITTEDVVLKSDESSVKVPVVSEEYGIKSNATAGLIRELVTPIQEIESVINTNDWITSEASNEENDAQLLERYKLQWRARSGVTAASYALAALSVQGVEGVKIFDKHPRGQGTIDVVVLGTSGVPTDELIGKAKDAIKDTIIINDDVLVKKVTPKVADVSIAVEYTSGNLEVLRSAVEQSIRKKFADISKQIGVDMIQAKIVSDVINLPGIKRILWASPATDITINNSEVFVLNKLNVEMIWVTDE